MYASLEDHPFPRLRDAGVVVTLNSDDPAMFGSWVSDEYRVARDAFGYDDADLADIARPACGRRSPTTTQARILRDIDAWLAADESARGARPSR